MDVGYAIRQLAPGWEGSCGFDKNNVLNLIKTADGCSVEAPSVADVLDYIEQNKDGYVEKQKAARAIAALESQITPRRLREAVLGIDGGWLETKNAEIKKLRESL